MPKEKIQAVVFDLDGLLFNTEELYQRVGTELLRRRGKKFDKPLLDAMMGRPNRVSFQIMIEWHELEDSVHELATESAEIFGPILDEHLSLMPGAGELLDALEAHQIPKAIATSSGRSFVTRVLGSFELERRFAFILTSEDITEGKPHPEIYVKAASRLGVSPSDMLVLEDSENGCRAAVAAGAVTIAVPGDHSRDHDFQGARHVAASLADPAIYVTLGINPGQ
jgi:HAD superfamily hydrolase (TIGR01509 family)